MEKLVITVAITGSKITRETTPYIPITPGEIVASAIECREAAAPPKDARRILSLRKAIRKS